MIYRGMEVIQNQTNFSLWVDAFEATTISKILPATDKVSKQILQKTSGNTEAGVDLHLAVKCREESSIHDSIKQSIQ